MSTSNPSTPLIENILNDESSTTNISTDDNSMSTSSSHFECDIGKLIDLHVDLNRLSRQDKYRVLIAEPHSDASTYPRTQTNESSSYRQFHPSWLRRYPWLHYSRSVDGAFCRACAFFAPNQAGGQDLGQFVTKPFKAWIKMSRKATTHAQKNYHLTAMTKMEEFLVRYQNPTQAVGAVLNNESRQIMENNQKVIESLLKVVMLCGKQGLALRGHRDDTINWEEESTSNEGNFIQLVRFRAETDPILANHLAKSPRNAHYTSKTIQNELVGVIGNCIRGRIIDEVKRAQFYSIIADEVTDTANKEQLSLVLRYVLDNDVKEVFVDFVEVDRITGEVLAKSILHSLRMYGLSPTEMRGQCYDGASNMSGARSGCKSIVQQAAPLAMYYHCAAHHLNLAVVAACKVQALKNAESYVGEIARFFKFSPKRQRLLDKAIDSFDSTLKANKLKDACRTRWVERIDSYVVFLELLPAVHTCLKAMVHPHMHNEQDSTIEFKKQFIQASKLGKQLHGDEFDLDLVVTRHIVVILHHQLQKITTASLYMMSFFHMLLLNLKKDL